jgi:hypothetical protein
VKTIYTNRVGETSDRTRDQAAKILSAIACGAPWSYIDLARNVGGGPAAVALALRAAMGVEPDDIETGPSNENWPAVWAEAESRIRNHEVD